jgi:hypothetical protein
VSAPPIFDFRIAHPEDMITVTAFGGSSAGTSGYNQTESPACLQGSFVRSSTEVELRLTVQTERN